MRHYSIEDNITAPAASRHEPCCFNTLCRLPMEGWEQSAATLELVMMPTEVLTAEIELCALPSRARSEVARQ